MLRFTHSKVGIGFFVLAFAAAGPALGDDTSDSGNKVDQAISGIDALWAHLPPKPSPTPEEKKADEFRKGAYKFIKDEQKNQTALDGTVAVGLSGDDASQVILNGTSTQTTSLYKVNAEIDLSRGTYPRKMVVKAGASVQLKDGSLQQEDTTLLINYDYYMAPWSEVYGFAERFSDSFMSIQERYEVGFGTKLVFRGGWTGKANESTDESGQVRHNVLKEFCHNPYSFLSAFQNREAAKEALENLKTAACGDCLNGDLLTGIKTHYSKLEIGLALSAFWELEHPEMQVFLDPTKQGSSPATTTTQFSVPSETHFRGTIRPTIQYRVLDKLRLYAVAYFKLPLGSFYKTYFNTTNQPMRRLDWRFEPAATAELKIDKKTSLVVDWRWRYANAPPQLGADVIAQQQLLGNTVRNPVARDRHGTVTLKLQVAL